LTNRAYFRFARDAIKSEGGRETMQAMPGNAKHLF
jgi:hypothetical protein